MKRLITAMFLCLGAFGLLLWSQPAQASVALIINDNPYHSEPLPELKAGRVYVPLRTISEGLGYNVDWNAESRAVMITTQDADVNSTVSTGKDVAVFINGERLYMNKGMGTPYIKNPGYTMVPLRAVSEGLGALVDWHDGLVTVSSEPAENEPAPELIQSVAEETWLPKAHEEADETDTLPVLPLSDFLDDNEKDIHDASSLSDDASNLTILGDSVATLDQVNRFLSAKEDELRHRAAVTGRTFVPFPKNIGSLYLSIAPKYGIRGDVALAQAIQETGYFQYGNEVLPEQNNYCGLGAIGRRTTEEDLEKQVFSNIDASAAHLTVGLHGWCYATPAIGVEAHLQHLYSYASADPLPKGVALYDGRFQHGNRGKAVVWHDLNGRWAVPGNGYGETIVENIWRNMLSY